MAFVTRSFPVVLLHDFIEVACCVCATLDVDFIEELSELVLQSLGLSFKLSTSLSNLISQRNISG